MISVITVCYKSADHVEAMLESLLRHAKDTEMEVFVVINGDGTDPLSMRARYPNARFIVSERNLGFAGGNNLAISEARGDYILLVNPDVVFTENAVQKIEERMQNDADVGIGGISLRNSDGSRQHCVWRFPTPVDQLLLMLKVPHAFPNIGPIRRYLMRDFDYSRTQDVDQVMGAFFCIRRETLADIGPLDDGFFVWYEEVDFCRRARTAGWRTRYYADVSARHEGAGTFNRVTTLRKQAMMRRSLRRYMRKHFGVGPWLLFCALNPLFVLLAAASAILKPH